MHLDLCPPSLILGMHFVGFPTYPYILISPSVNRRRVIATKLSRFVTCIIQHCKMAETSVTTRKVCEVWPKPEFRYSGFSSHRINLSPFTKDFRGEEQNNESKRPFFKPYQVGWNILNPSKHATGHTLSRLTRSSIVFETIETILQLKPSPSIIRVYYY